MLVLASPGKGKHREGKEQGEGQKQVHGCVCLQNHFGGTEECREGLENRAGISPHALKDNKKIKASKKLKELHDLRKKADYDLFNPLTNNDLDKAMKNMNDIINELEFQKGE